MSGADPWVALRAHTAARIALGRSGASLPTAEWLRFGIAHAMARDAVHAPFDAASVRRQLADAGIATLEVRSAAPDRATYLRRPDLGRRLDDASAQALAAGGADVLIVVGDGLSAAAVHRNAVPLVTALHARLSNAGVSLAPVVVAHQARVALGDAIAERLAARFVVMLVGERPGLSSPDSLGAYLTLAPRVGCTDAMRNCVSNIRAEGLPVEQAAHRILWLIDAARRMGATGVALKDESGGAPPARVRSA